MKKWILVATILLIILVIAIIMIAINNKEEINTSFQPLNKTQENVIQNETINETINEISSPQNKTENTQIQSSEVLPEEQKTAEEKAIDIVKKDWGNDETVKFSVEGMNQDGKYVVVVRGTTTTQAKAFYYVNIVNGNFDKKEID